MWKPRFIRDLTDNIYSDEYDDFDDVYEQSHNQYDDADDTDYDYDTEDYAEDAPASEVQSAAAPSTDDAEVVLEQLELDVYQTPDEIVVRTMIPGVPSHSVDITLTRDMLTIECTRDEEKEVVDDDYFYRELYWGSMTRTITLPAEVDVDAADAKERNGVLTIRLPKINKDRQAKLKVRSH